MKALFFTIPLSLFLASALLAQDFSFKVLANKGTNEVYPKSAEAIWEPLKTGTTLKSGDKIKIDENAYVGLMHSSGRTLELKSEGEYEVNELAGMISGNTSVASKYASFIMSKMTDGQAEADINKVHRDHLKVTGAVERSIVMSGIQVMMPSSANVLNSDALIKWNNVRPNEQYIVTFTNIYDEVITTKETSEPNYRINLNDPLYSNEKLVVFNIKVKGDDQITSENYGLKRMSAEASKAISEDLEVLKAELKEETAMNKLILASFYEQHNLIVDALTNYEEAIDLYPEVNEFKIAYQQFMDRNDLVN